MSRAWLYSLTIVIGLWISATGAGGLLADNYAEWPVNIWCWAVFASASVISSAASGLSRLHSDIFFACARTCIIKCHVIV